MVGAWDSDRQKKVTTVRMPPRITRSQKTHLQPAFCAMKPPMTGPRTGPRNIPVKRIDMTAPRLAGATWSAMLAPPTFMGPAPKQPAMKRKMMKLVMLGARAQPMVKPRCPTLETL